MMDEQSWLWFKEQTNVIRCEDTAGIVAYDERGIQGVCVADHFGVDSCNVHFCIPNPMSIRAGLFALFAEYLGKARGMTRLFGFVPENQPKSLQLTKHIGFKEVSRIPDVLNTGEGYVVMSIRIADWVEQNEQKEAA
jgi:hypothetical protein